MKCIIELYEWIIELYQCEYHDECVVSLFKNSLIIGNRPLEETIPIWSGFPYSPINNT